MENSITIITITQPPNPNSTKSDRESSLQEIMSVVTYNYKQISLPEDIAAQTFYINHILIHLCDEMIPNSFGVLSHDRS